MLDNNIYLLPAYQKEKFKLYFKLLQENKIFLISRSGQYYNWYHLEVVESLSL